MIRVFVGYDTREAVAYHVLSHSILSRASEPVSVTPLALSQLRGLYKRERGPLESSEFSLTRFLVPYLSGFQGRSIYMDCDMLMLDDVAAIPLEGSRAVWVAKHDYVPRATTKKGGKPQTAYPRKNWSSLMVFNNAACWRLTPEYVNEASALDLHRFEWLSCPACRAGTCMNPLPEHAGDEAIGSIPLEWNWLVGEYGGNPAAKVLHYTLGGPWNHRDATERAEDWMDAYREMIGVGRNPA